MTQANKGNSSETEPKPVFKARDDRFHFGDLGADDWWATETAWFSFHCPERKMGGWLYTLVRPNIGTVAGGAWVWDDSAHLPWNALYSANFSALELPRNQDLDDIDLPTGVSVRAVEACTSYELSYLDEGRLTVSLQFDGVMPPEPLTAAGSTFGRASHFDQIGRVHGNIVLHGERIEIDCFSFRDRTWGRRREERPRQAAYVTGCAGANEGFLAVTNVDKQANPIAYGFLRRNGETIPIKHGERIIERDAREGWVTRVVIQGEDLSGRRLHMIGTPQSRIILNRHSFIDVNSLILWESDKVQAWGEDQDMWPVHTWSKDRRKRTQN